MSVSIMQSNLLEVESDVLVLGLFEGECLPEEVLKVDKLLGGFIQEQIVKKEKFEAKNETMALFHTYSNIKSERILLVGLGKKEDFDSNRLRVLASLIAQKFKKDDSAKKIATNLMGLNKDSETKSFTKAFVEGFFIGDYVFDKYKSKKTRMNEKELILVEPSSGLHAEIQAGVEKALIVVKAMNLAKDMINEPAEQINPNTVAQIAKSLKGVDVKIYEKSEIEKLGMGAYLAVGIGSSIAPKFIHIKYAPKTATKKIALVGKCVTFDSGGLDLKPPSSMLNMKDDMSGAACVISVMSVISELKPDVEVHALIPAAENMPSGHAYKPGDVLKAMDGKTIEVDNTDAEGRLTLADGICFAQQKIGVDEIVDIATLTGACMVALGSEAFALMGNNQKFIDDLKACAVAGGENAWQLPMFDGYANSLKSDIADMKNTGSRYGGAIVAGKFIEKFVDKKVRWTHIDIAGTAYIEKNIKEVTKGATASGVRTLINYLES